jgi:Protein of unknown function (DUF2612)
MGANFVNVVRVLIEGKQEIENATQQLIVARSLDDAEGVALDTIGKFVVQSRGGLDDDLYRRILRARIAANRSDGRVPDMLRVTKLVINDIDDTVFVHYINDGLGEARILIEDLAIDDDIAAVLIRLIVDAQAGGVRHIVEYGADPVEEWFTLDAGVDEEGLDTGSFVNRLDRVA